MLTKVHLVKALVFPVVIYGCKSWKVRKKVRKLERNLNAKGLMLLNCGVGKGS